MTMKNVELIFRFKDEKKDIVKGFSETSLEYVTGVAKRYAPIYEKIQNDELIGVLIDFEDERKFRNAIWVL